MEADVVYSNIFMPDNLRLSFRDNISKNVYMILLFIWLQAYSNEQFTP